MQVTGACRLSVEMMSLWSFILTFACYAANINPFTHWVNDENDIMGATADIHLEK